MRPEIVPMAKNVPRRHHYVPRSLLANFTNTEGKLWTYDAEQKKSWHGKPAATGFERDLYAVTGEDGDKDFDAVEKFLAATVDGPGAGAVSGLLGGECLPAKRWVCFIGFVAAQMVRTPAFFDRLTAMMKPAMQETFERVAKFHPEFRANVTQALTEAGATPEDIQEQFRAMEKGGYLVDPHREFVLVHSLRLVVTLHEQLLKMKWGILRVLDGEPDLILGDHPVMLSDEGPDDEPPRALGLMNPNIELIMPLSKRMVAIGRWRGQSSFGHILKGSADVINERTLRYARRFVFAPYESEDLLAREVKLNGTGPTVRIRRMRIGRGLVIAHEYR